MICIYKTLNSGVIDVYRSLDDTQIPVLVANDVINKLRQCDACEWPITNDENYLPNYIVIEGSIVQVECKNCGLLYRFNTRKQMKWNCKKLAGASGYVALTTNAEVKAHFENEDLWLKREYVSPANLIKFSVYTRSGEDMVKLGDVTLI
jgi:hypothetical protein